MLISRVSDQYIITLGGGKELQLLIRRKKDMGDGKAEETPNYVRAINT